MARKTKHPGQPKKGAQVGETVAYSRVNRPVRLQPIDQHSGKVLYKETIVVFPSEGTRIKHALFQTLKKQNPLLISDKPYSKKDDPEISREKKYIEEAGLKVVEGKPMSQQEIASQNRFIKASEMSTVHSLDKEAIAKIKDQPPPEKKDGDDEERGEGPGENPYDFIEGLQQYSEVPNPLDLTPDELKAFGAKLGIYLEPGDKPAWINQLNARAKVLTETLKAMQKG